MQQKAERGGREGGGIRYRVVFLGAAERDFKAVDRLVENLQKVFGLSLEAVTYMMRAVPLTLKNGATFKEAMRYKKAFKAIGGRVLLEEDHEHLSPQGP